MQEIVNALGQYGALAIIAGICLWKNFTLSDKLLSVIENNTSAMTELKIYVKQIVDKN